MKADVSAMTTTGRRHNNQDAFCVDNDLGLFAVADGMGGYRGGEVASRLALDAVREFLRAKKAKIKQTWSFRRGDAEPLDENRVEQAIRVAHRSILEARNAERPKMGTTIATVVKTTNDGPVVVAHVGDSRVYRWSGGKLQPLTRDHSYVEELRDAGAIGPDEDLPNLRNYLTRALGIPGWANPTVTRATMASGDRFLLCTDGLTGALCDGQIAALMKAPTCRDAVERLVDAAYTFGSTDNITAIVIEIA